MNLQGKVALVTGASSGIGYETSVELAKLGMNLILVARREDKLQKLKDELVQNYHIKVEILKLDVSNKDMVQTAISNLTNEWKDIYLLVNNAGLALTSSLIQDGELRNWDTMIDVNLKGLLYMTHAVLPIMIKNDSGHIVNISSTAGHDHYLGGNVYCATKHAIASISKSLRIDLLGKKIRVTEIAPGAVGDTEFSQIRWDSKEKAQKFYSTFNSLIAKDIADAISYCVTRRQEVNVSEMIIFPLDQGSANHLQRKDGQVGGTFNFKK